MRIKMLKTTLGSPNGIIVNNYVEGEEHVVSEDLAREFLLSGAAVSAEPDQPVTIQLNWPPSEQELAEMSFSALGVLLEGKGIPLGALKSVEGRQDAVKSISDHEKRVSELNLADWPLTDEQIDALESRDLAAWLSKKGVDPLPITSKGEALDKLKALAAADAPAPWPKGHDDGRVPDAHLARELKARGVDMATMTSRAIAEAKLRELMGVVELPTDEQIDALDEPTMATLLAAREKEILDFPDAAAARATLKELIAKERAAQE